MMSRSQALRDPILIDAEAYESAVLEALDVIDGDDVRQKLDSFRRFARIFSTTIDWAYEQKVQASRHLASRGRIKHTDWEDVLKALEQFDKEEIQQNPHRERAGSAEKRPITTALH
jgi:hypothetical protein